LKKPSSSKLLPDRVFFTDADLGPTEDCDVVRILRAAGLRVEPHHSHFPPGTDDHVWLAGVAARGWIPITKDDRIRYSPLAKAVIMEMGVQLFVCIGDWPHVQLAENLVNSLARVERHLQKERQPFIARVYMAKSEDRFSKGKGGEVKLWLTHAQWVEESGGIRG
jgi:hypothetical protein